MYHIFKQNYKSISFIIAFSVLCVLVSLYANAVFDIPIGNMKHAEKLEQKGRFKEAAESRELAAEFYEYVSIPQHEDDLEYYTQKGDENKVQETKEMLEKFQQWLKECRAKAQEDREKSDSTPEEIESYREKIRTRLIASAKLYPGFISVDGGQVANLETNGKFSDDFIKAAETRERIARLYEKDQCPLLFALSGKVNINMTENCFWRGDYTIYAWNISMTKVTPRFNYTGIPMRLLRR
jgi:hypothetical protein